ncbi:hypothetical protein E1J17_09370 [Kocuria rosea]|nr:hypothetical protein [Kocuria rosea]THE17818.1 hypothetical protein E1J17_09370 [Kocuria rosea]
MTTNSQPGWTDTSGRSGQRAYVTGFCSEEVAATIEAGLLFNELIAVMFAPTVDAFSSITVTIDGNEPFTFLGRWSGGELDFYRNGDAHLNAALDLAWGVQIFDPVWGRNDRLWGAVLHALNT